MTVQLTAGGLAAAALCAAQVTGDAALTQARGRALESISRLPGYTCTETIERRFFVKRNLGPANQSCDQMIAPVDGRIPYPKLLATDRIRLDAWILDGREIDIWPGGGRLDSQWARLVKGPVGVDSLTELLRSILRDPAIHLVTAGQVKEQRTVFVKYTFQVPVTSSRYYVDTAGDWRAVAYSGEIWIDAATAEIRRLVVHAGVMPGDVNACAATTTVNYSNSRIGAGDFLTPTSSTESLVTRNLTESEIRTTYSACRVPTEPLEAHSGMHPQPSGMAPALSEFRRPIFVEFKLDQEIDTDTAAVGDLVSATVTDSIEDPRTHTVLIPSRATVRGRIVRMEHWLNSPRRFLIGIQLQTITIDGVDSPFRATTLETLSGLNSRQWSGFSAVVDGESGASKATPPLLPLRDPDTPVGMVTIVNGMDRRVLHKGWKSTWITVPNPPPADAADH